MNGRNSALLLTLLLPLPLLVLAPPARAGGEDDAPDGEARPAAAGAARFKADDVPPALRPWIKWATDGAPPAPCPAVNGAAVCAWPGRLALALDGGGGAFSQSLHAGGKLRFPLPGDDEHWPLAVTLDGKPAPVVPDGGRPALVVEPGEHAIAGRFAWAKLPDAFSIPPATALVALSIGGRPVARPSRDEAGTLALRSGGGGGEAEGDAVRLRLFRRLQDGQPLWLDSEFRLTVSGRARELRIPGANYPGALPVSVAGELPARLDPDGALRIQVRPGNYSVVVRGKLPDPPPGGAQEFKIPALEAAKTPGMTVAPQEIWSFARDAAFREVAAEGGDEIDPARAEAPPAWRALPAYALSPGQSFALRETRRGAPPAPPDAVAVAREWWLDEDGRSFTVLDRLSGTLQRTQRLEMAAPAALGSAALGGEPQLITGGGAPGVEVRTQRLELTAVSRMARGGKLPAAGWNFDAASLRTVVHLPPGWRLFAAPGADRTAGAWTEGWTPWDFFFLVIVSAALVRFAGWRWGLLAFVTLTLSYHETLAPRWSWLALIAATGLLAIKGAGGKTAIRLVWGGCALSLVLLLLPFFLDQARMALYPDLHPYEARSASISSGFAFSQDGVRSLTRGKAAPAPPKVAIPESPAAVPQASMSVPVAAAEGREMAGDEEDRRRDAPQRERTMEKKAEGRLAMNALSDVNITNSGYRERAVQQAQEAYRQDPHAIIQTGPGVPDWDWTSAELSWNGPVPEDFRVRLWLLPRWLNFLLGILRIFLSAALAFALFRFAGRAFAASAPEANNPSPRPSGPPPPGGTPLPAGALALLLLAPAAARAQGGAEYPPPALLEQLREKLTRRDPPPLCGANCLATASGKLAIAGGALSLELEVHAGAEGGWPLPGPLAAWAPESVSLDGKPAAGLVRLDDGFLHLRVPPGVHAVKLAGPLPPRDAFTLEFKLPPRHASVSAGGWRVDGLKGDGGPAPAWQFTRLIGAGGGGAISGGRYATWLEVRRELQIGLDWKVVTTVRRLSPGDAPVVAGIPLLRGMLVTGEREVKDDAVTISLGQGEAETSFEATLKPVADAPVALKAPEGKNWSEVWVVRCGPVWQCEADGLPPSARWDGGGAALVFRPWPGEAVALKFHRPEGLAGRTQTRTVDRAALEVTPGPRLLDASLTLSLRAARAGALALTLPADAELESVSVNQSAQPAQLSGGKLSVNHEAGASTIAVNWREPRGWRLLFRAPRVAIAGGAVNATITVRPPPGRWLLYAFGPAWGPAILFWGAFAVVLLAAWGLGRLPLSPLKGREWMLLAAGLTQIPPVVSLMIVAWFFLLALRARRAPGPWWRFNLMQFLLAGWTACFLAGLVAAIHAGLMVAPDMQVTGNGSTQSELHWRIARVAGELPAASVLSVGLWFYRALVFAWALWLAFSLLKWLQRGWRDFSAGGAWMAKPEKPAVPPPPPNAP